MAEKRKVEKVVLPKGVAKWCRLDTPDTKFWPQGMYRCDVAIPAKDAKAIVDKITSVQKAEAKTSGAKKMGEMPFEVEVDDQGNKTGNVVFKLKAKNRTTKDGKLWDRKPAVFDIYGNKLEERVGGGSVVKAAVQLVPAVSKGMQYVSLHLDAVQVVELVEYQSGSAKSFGFDVEKAEGNATEDNVGTENEDEDLF